MKDIHVMPQGDLITHKASMRCACIPIPDKENPRVKIHNKIRSTGWICIINVDVLYSSKKAARFWEPKGKLIHVKLTRITK